MLFEKFLRIFWIYFAFLVVVQAQVDKPCTLRNGASGVCKVDTSCPKAKQDAERGIQSTICGVLYDSVIVVCCEGATVANVQANENSFVGVDTEDDDRIIYENDNDFSKNKNLPLSERKCLDYNRNVYQTIPVAPLLLNPRPTSTLIAKCAFSGIPLVVGGTPALPGEFPFMALLGYNDGNKELLWNCGGTLISDFYVMTAAHCAISRYGKPVTIRLGELDLSKDNDSSQDFNISEIIEHNKYNPVTKNNDIALIKLSKAVKFNNFIRPACLWHKPYIKRSTAIATGWGVTESGGTNRSDVLLKVTLNLLNKSLCDKTYTKHFSNGIPETMLCAGVLAGGHDTCQGDSGGPLFITKDDNQCIFYAVGITSFGQFCGMAKIAGVYTKVSEFIPWIESIVWK